MKKIKRLFFAGCLTLIIFSFSTITVMGNPGDAIIDPQSYNPPKYYEY